MSAGLLVLVAWLDALLGDPRWFPHPVRAIGAAIQSAERAIRAHVTEPSSLRLAGVALALLLPTLVYIIAEWTIAIGAILSPWIGGLLLLVIAWTTVAARDLWDHARAVFHALSEQDLAGARRSLSLIVGRDTDQLDDAEVIRATIETLAESTADGIVAPLFYLAIGGAPLALAYKAVNTLDSMVGHREPPYRELGWASARLDDALNWIPARIAAWAIGLAAGWVRGDWSLTSAAWRIAWRDGDQHPSPNSGRPEAAMAGALSVQLGGVNTYDGVPHPRPLLGDPIRALTLDVLDDGIRVMAAASLIALAAAVAGLRLWHGSWW